jgi:hypothetical protein
MELELSIQWIINCLVLPLVYWIIKTQTKISILENSVEHRHKGQKNNIIQFKEFLEKIDEKLDHMQEKIQDLEKEVIKLKKVD